MPASTPATSLPAIQIDHVSRHYTMGESSIRAVDDVSLVVPTGEFLALLGSSGSGKSTLLNLMAGLDRPTSGSIVSGGRNLAELSPLDLARYRRNTVGMVFQSFNLLPRMTLEENVELPLRLAEVERGERSARVQEALERVRLAKRTGHRPSALLREIQSTMGMTIVMVTHERHLAERFADRLATMGDGKLLSTAATEAHASTHLTTQATTGAGQ